MKRFLPLFIIFMFSFSYAAEIKNVYWEPAEPKPGDDITVYAEIEGNVSSVAIQYCIGEACFPATMEKVSDNLWKFVIDGEQVKEGKIEVNVTINVNGSKIYMEKEIEVKKEGKTPGFEMIAVVSAIVAVAMLVKIKSRK